MQLCENGCYIFSNSFLLDCLCINNNICMSLLISGRDILQLSHSSSLESLTLLLSQIRKPL